MSDIIAVIALIIASLSAYFSWKDSKTNQDSLKASEKSLQESKKFNQLSLKPLLTFYCDDSQKITLSNKGNGPAVIIEIKYKGEKNPKINFRRDQLVAEEYPLSTNTQDTFLIMEYAKDKRNLEKIFPIIVRYEDIFGNKQKNIEIPFSLFEK